MSEFICLLLIWPSKLAESWKDIVELVVIVVAAVMGLIQLRLILKQSREQQKIYNYEILRERRERTLELDSKIAELSEDRRKVESAFHRGTSKLPIPLTTIKEELSQDPHLEGSLRKVLGQLEIFALPVCARASDEDMAFELLGSSVVWYGGAFLEYIENLRVNNNQPKLYIYLSYLSVEWDARLKQSTEPVFIKERRQQIGEARQ